MKPRFNPKFTIATAYPMMFSSADLGHIELDMLNAILTEKEIGPPHLLAPSENGYVNPPAPDGFYNWLSDSEFEWLYLSRQLENIWEIEPEDSFRKDLKSPKKT
ncbi:hypothetical protein IQ260_26845 [Leptolyngbya cf. ectocarpi LEGE 11479]|uniref:Uncharacterized protein n=1 Tax=Leptolyngbya cf. ectocarpi LEGE 11479 TaxID=1828722 RepID=A0A929FA91_LEPEC|nr:hypothetical protein [Leptolyngbya ectocarpi]MBE9070265.1 hypothetical protein [Leptolyngbya cf. ectocarpi LEGE 11479]